jgi:pimeloyl-ACP methyl ester carboxylesterase
MSNTNAAAVSRVPSVDGTQIAWWTSGSGPPLVVVHGTPADHTRWRPLLPFLEPHVTVHAVDRRGRGASDDGAAYSIEREYEDIACVVEAVARHAGTRVDLYGHSHGGFVAFGAATLTSSVRKLVLYEGWPVPDPAVLALPRDTEERIEALVANGDRDEAIATAIRAFTLMSDQELNAFRAAPSWAGRVAAAHTITREIRGAASTSLDPVAAAKIRVPTLLITGQKSRDPSRLHVDAMLAALPNARHVVLERQEHVADAIAPEIFAPPLLAFLESPEGDEP